MKKIITILFCSVFFCVSVHGESNRTKWLHLKNDLVGYLDPCWQNIRSHKPAWDKQSAGRKEIEQTMTRLRQLYERAVKVPLNPVFDRALYMEQQRTIDAVWALIMELGKWNSYNDIEFGTLDPIPVATRTDYRDTTMRRGKQPRPTGEGLRTDVREINAGLYRKTENRINDQNWLMIEGLLQLRSNDSVIVKNIAFSFRIEHYITMVAAYKELEHIIAPEKIPVTD